MEFKDFQFRLVLSGAGVEIERTLSPQQASLIMNVVMGMEPKAKPVGPAPLEWNRWCGEQDERVRYG